MGVTRAGMPEKRLWPNPSPHPNLAPHKGEGVRNLLICKGLRKTSPCKLQGEGAALSAGNARETAATSGRVIFFELAVQRRQTDIQNAGSELPIASMPPQCLCDRFSFNLG